MQVKIATFIILFATMGCGRESTEPTVKRMDFGAFSLEVPASWRKIEQNGIDSYAGAIAIDSTDTLEFDYGMYSNSLNETDPQIIDSSWLIHMNLTKEALAEMIVVKNKDLVDPDRYKYNNVSWDTIDGRPAKLVYPRKSGKGTTGVFFDSVAITRGNDLIRFNLYGVDLQPANEEQTRQAIKTLVFGKK